MKADIIEMHTLFEIAMSIGNSLDMDVMLTECLPAYLTNLNFSGGAVFEMTAKSNGFFGFDIIYSIPTKLVRNTFFEKEFPKIPRQMDEYAIKAYLNRLPICEKSNKLGLVYIARLSTFGLLILTGGQCQQKDSWIKELVPINRKLAQACVACKKNENIKKEVERRRKSEKEAIESKERLKKIFDTVPSGMVIVDETNRCIVDANAQALKIFQVCDIDDVIGKKCHHYICPADEVECKGIDNPERIVINQSGELIPVLKTLTRITLEGRPHLLESFIDIKKQKVAEREQKKAEEKLNRLQRLDALGILAGGIAHDFNNILSSINGYTELALLDVEKHSIMEENLKAMHMAGQRAKKLVGQILTFARKTEDDIQPVRVGLIAKEAITLLRPSVQREIKIITNINSNALIMGDPTKIHQIIVNLCNNGLHAMGERGILEVRLSETKLDGNLVKIHPEVKPGRYLELMVSDTGKGIPADMVEAIFEPYFTTKEAGEGTGLGLSVVHSIVTGYGGAVLVSSKIGKGSVFMVYLPIAKELHSRQVDHKEGLPRGDERILFVDDEQDITNVGTQLLGRLGYQVTPQNNSLEALKRFSETPDEFDLVITDLVMPDMAGDELSSKLRKIRHDTPIILCTGYSKYITGEHANKIGIEAFALKPLNKLDLALIVREVLDKANRIKKFQSSST
jgi:signal transduction histidine kinase/CheY-like chemotaxis protein